MDKVKSIQIRQSAMILVSFILLIEVIRLLIPVRRRNELIKNFRESMAITFNKTTANWQNNDRKDAVQKSINKYTEVAVERVSADVPSSEENQHIEFGFFHQE